jgi:hypothetical protein
MYLAVTSVRRVQDITEASGRAGVAIDSVGHQQEDIRDDRGFGAVCRSNPYVYLDRGIQLGCTPPYLQYRSPGVIPRLGRKRVYCSSSRINPRPCIVFKKARF